MPTPEQYLLMCIVGAACLTLFFALRLFLEVRVGHVYRQLVRDVRRLEARLREMEILERARPFVMPIPMMN